MKILIVLPDCNYFLWQMLVQINNFRKLGIEKDVIYLIGKNTLLPSNNLMKILNGKIKSEIHIIDDDRVNPAYSSSLRPHIIAKFFEKFPEKVNDIYFYIDPDVLFTKKIKLTELEQKNNIWYLSDTRSYINSQYIRSKGENLFNEMCKIVKIDPQIVIDNDNNAGGAQYIMKNLSVDYWKKVETDSENLYKYMISTSSIYSPEHPIQAWTSDMWAVLWNAWYFGHETKIIKKLNFSWATDRIKKWNECSIYHNAGAVINNGIYFLKTEHQTSPFNKNLDCSSEYCSYNYVNEIKETEINFQKILF